MVRLGVSTAKMLAGDLKAVADPPAAEARAPVQVAHVVVQQMVAAKWVRVAAAMRLVVMTQLVAVTVAKRIGQRAARRAVARDRAGAQGRAEVLRARQLQIDAMIVDRRAVSGQTVD